ncbi:MAG TPA: hypothetical protein VGL91_14265 [Acidobacteriota bacterium]
MNSKDRETLRIVIFDKRHYLASRLPISDVRRISSLELPDTLVGLEVLLLGLKDRRWNAVFTTLWLNAERPKFEEVGKGIIALDLQEHRFAALTASRDIVFLYRDGIKLRRFQSVNLDEIQAAFLARELQSYVRLRPDR